MTRGGGSARLWLALALALAVGLPGCATIKDGYQSAVSGLASAVGAQSPSSVVYELTKTRNTLQASINIATRDDLISVELGRNLTDKLAMASVALKAARGLLAAGSDATMEIDTARAMIGQVSTARQRGFADAGGEG